MNVRTILVSAVAAVMVAGGVSLAAAPAATAGTCPTLAPYPNFPPGSRTVTPAPTYEVDWSGCDLYNANLSGADLSGADLSGANLSGANLRGADLGYATLTGATLTGANLNGANLGYATLTGADLRDVDLTNAQLSFVDLSNAQLDGTYPAYVCGSGGPLGFYITGTPKSLPPGWSLSNRTLTAVGKLCSSSGATPATDADCPTVDQATGVVTPRLAPGLNYRGCSFVGANLDGVDLTGAELGSTQWGENSAVQVVLTGADLSEAVFLGPVNLTRATLTGANLDKADLAEAFVTAAGDTGELGCAITGKPRTLPTRWALANGCLKTKGASADQAPRPCRAVTVDTDTAPIPFTKGDHALWVEGDLSCAEATAIVEDVTEDGTVNSRIISRTLSRAIGDRVAIGGMSVALSDTETLSVSAEPIETDSASQQRVRRLFRTEVTYRQANDTGATTLITHSWDRFSDSFDRDNCRIIDNRTGLCVG